MISDPEFKIESDGEPLPVKIEEAFIIQRRSGLLSLRIKEIGGERTFIMRIFAQTAYDLVETTPPPEEEG